VFTAQLALPPRYDRAKLITFYEQLYQRLSSLPSASSAALTDRVPLTGGLTPAPVAVMGNSLPPLSERLQANRHLVSPKYFATLGIPIRAGRDFGERDNSTVPHVVIVNETFAKQFFGGENPIGRTLVTGMAQLPSQIVGVCADVRSTTLNQPPTADYFLPALQRPEAFTNILVRTNVGPAAIAPVVREALRTVDPELPLLQPQMLTTSIARTVADRRLALMLLGAFGVLALVLASLGVYIVMEHLVTFRTSEIGLRMALGAQLSDVQKLILKQGMLLAVIGAIIGLAIAFGGARLMKSLLYGVSASDPITFTLVGLLLLGIALLACWIPARRASRIEPMIALRAE